MTFKEFTRWCNDRCFDACWGMQEAMICIGVMEEVKQNIWFKREKVWKEQYEKDVVEAIVKPLDKKREEVIGVINND